MAHLKTVYSLTLMWLRRDIKSIWSYVKISSEFLDFIERTPPMHLRIVPNFIILYNIQTNYTRAPGKSGYNAITVGTHIIIYIYIYKCLYCTIG